jgi:Lon protease-like protein
MNKNPFAPDFEELPPTLPIFPLAGILLLPGGHLPLHVFEPRYCAMVMDAMRSDRMIGMIQPQDSDAVEIGDDTPVHRTGCAGKITEFSETPDGRFMIALTGVCRFDCGPELPVMRGYRRIHPLWDKYKSDLLQDPEAGIDRLRLKETLQIYFKKEGMDCDWVALEGASDGRLMTCLSMVCCFDAQEKQALLEADCCKARARMFMTMLDMAVCANRDCKSRH